MLMGIPMTSCEAGTIIFKGFKKQKGKPWVRTFSCVKVCLT